jgi:dTDP-glucose pyrophosphorylase
MPFTLPPDDHMIQSGTGIMDAIEKLDKHAAHKTLFVCKGRQVAGSLTDGDFRRGLLAGLTLDDKVDDFMYTGFSCLENNHIDPARIREIKESGIKLLPVLNEKREMVKLYDLNKLHTILPLDVIIMAGGRGERLKPLTDHNPKPMLPLGDKPIIQHLVDGLLSYGIENIRMSVNYLAGKIMDYFGDGSGLGIRISYVKEEQHLGTMGSLSLVKELHHENLLVINADLFTNIDLEDLYTTFIENQADLAVASVPYTVNIPYAIFGRDDTVITSVHEKPNNTHYANAGIYILKRELVSHIPYNQHYNATDFIHDMIARGKKIIHNPIVGYWIDIGKPEDYRKAEEIVKHI